MASSNQFKKRLDRAKAEYPQLLEFETKVIIINEQVHTEGCFQVAFSANKNLSPSVKTLKDLAHLEFHNKCNRDVELIGFNARNTRLLAVINSIKLLPTKKLWKSIANFSSPEGARRFYQQADFYLDGYTVDASHSGDVKGEKFMSDLVVKNLGYPASYTLVVKHYQERLSSLFDSLPKILAAAVTTDFSNKHFAAPSRLTPEDELLRSSGDLLVQCEEDVKSSKRVLVNSSQLNGAFEDPYLLPPGVALTLEAIKRLNPELDGLLVLTPIMFRVASWQGLMIEPEDTLELDEVLEPDVLSTLRGLSLRTDMSLEMALRAARAVN